MEQISADAEPMQEGPFAPTWESLQQYEAPAWFRNAKFGIWAHWGPQCAPEAGDWYARHMYIEGHRQYLSHLEHYGHPSEVGFKDVINGWNAERWDPAALVARFKRAGAQYFIALANHHDNFDLWDSQYQPWNSVNLGPRTDVIDGWARAARASGLRFGVSVHAAHAWTWLETAQGADTDGSLAGVSYDGTLAALDGDGTWWQGYDPQALYAQSHPRSDGAPDPSAIHAQWAWGNGASVPDAAYINRFRNRTFDLINRYEPDMIYFDDTILPLYPISDAGLRIAAHFYNRNLRRHGSADPGVLFGKVLDETQRRCMVWDIERGQSDRIEPEPWQTDTCLGDWHYDRAIYARHGYKSAATVIHMLADVVSKNGNLLLSVPVRGDGTLDDDEIAILDALASWMARNGESIFDTRPWTIFGTGPALERATPLKAQGFNEGVPFGADDVRFTTKDDAVYAIVLGRPSGQVRIAALGAAAGHLAQPIRLVELLGGVEQPRWTQHADALVIEPPPAADPAELAVVFKIR